MASAPHRTRSEKVVFKIKNPGDYANQVSTCSPAQGPRESWQFCLKVYPNGFEKTYSGKLGAYVELVPPEQMATWECKDIKCTITVINRAEECTKSKTFSYTFSKTCAIYGWRGIMEIWKLRSPEDGFVDENMEMEIHAEVHNLPWTNYHPSLDSVDLTAEPKILKFQLPSGPPIYFDQRLLTAHCEFFQKMLDPSASWKESTIGEVDLRSEPHASYQTVSAVLNFLMTDSFKPGDDISLAAAVRCLADRFCIEHLVKVADHALTSLLSEDTVLQLLSQTLNTGSKAEAACWQMLESNSNVLVKQEAALDDFLQQHPMLAKRLILVGKKRKRDE